MLATYIINEKSGCRMEYGPFPAERVLKISEVLGWKLVGLRIHLIKKAVA